MSSPSCKDCGGETILLLYSYVCKAECDKRILMPHVISDEEWAKLIVPFREPNGQCLRGFSFCFGPNPFEAGAACWMCMQERLKGT